MTPYTYRGKVHFVAPTQTFSSGFAKRTLVLKEDRSDGTNNFAAFEFIKDKTRKCDGLMKGQLVEVNFYPNANESKKNPGQWFCSCKAVDLKVVGNAAGYQASATESAYTDDDNMPF